MMNAKSFNIILCPNYFCKLGSVILSRLSSACLQMTLSYLIKNDESVKNSFDILTIYEKASGSKVNYEKTKGLIPPPQIKPHTKVVISFTYFSGIPRISIS
jgi:hypothetical protein